MGLRKYRLKITRLINKVNGRAPFSFLRDVSGVLHVGANLGQERFRYAKYDVDVIWIEPIFDTFTKLKQNVESFPRQQAFNYLITDKNNESIAFNIANNSGESSSIFEFGCHKDIWPQVEYTHTIDLNSITLKTFISQEKIEIEKYDALVIDTQGAELLVLKGAKQEILQYFKYIKVEAADFEAYRGGCQLEDIKIFLETRGFKEFSRAVLAPRDQGGAYYDVVFKRINNALDFSNNNSNM